MVTKSQVRDNVYNSFRDRIVDQVSSVTLINSSVVTIKNTYSAYNEDKIKSSTDLPVLIIEYPTFLTNQDTVTKETYSGSVTISVYSTSREAAIKFMDKVDTAITSYRRELKAAGIEQIEIGNEDGDRANLGSFNGYFQSITYTFKVKTTRWS